MIWEWKIQTADKNRNIGWHDTSTFHYARMPFNILALLNRYQYEIRKFIFLYKPRLSIFNKVPCLSDTLHRHTRTSFLLIHQLQLLSLQDPQVHINVDRLLLIQKTSLIFALLYRQPKYIMCILTYKHNPKYCIRFNQRHWMWLKYKPDCSKGREDLLLTRVFHTS